MKVLKITLIFILGLTACQNRINPADYPQSEAVYLKLHKTYTLNEDGSMEYAYYKEQMLLTHRAFNSLYGQTNIYYNPETDSVIIDLAETVTPDGKTVPVPDNGIVDMIPGYATGSANFSHLRHKAVVHTALERQAIIKSAYRVISQPGSIPVLSAREIITRECPIRNYKLSVQVPKGQTISYRDFNIDSEPTIRTKGGFQIYTWEIQDIPQTTAEPMGVRFDRDKMQVMFSSGEDFFDLFNQLTSQKAFTFETSIDIRDRVNKETEGYTDDFRKLAMIHGMLLNEIQTVPVPLKQTGNRIRPAIQTWNSMAGTPEEKAVLLTALIRSIGMEAVPVAFVPEYLYQQDSSYQASGSLDLLAFSHVEVQVGSGTIYLDVNAKHQADPIHQFPQHLIVPFEMGYSRVNLRPVPKSDHQLSWDGTVIMERQGRLTGHFEGNYIGRTNPYLGLMLDPSSLSRIHPGTGSIEVASPRSTLLSYDVDLSDQVTFFADKVQFDLPLNASGFGSWGIHYLSESRTSPMELPSTLREFQRFDIRIPAGWTGVGFQKDVTVSNDVGRVSIRFSSEGEKLSVMRSLNIQKSRISAEEYSQLKKLIDPWLAKAYQTVILEKK